MRLFHGSNTAGIRVLEPRQADNDRPYIYLTTIDVVAAFYLCNAVERPYYWFPYGFKKGGEIPVYEELYPNALREVSEGVHGYLYEVEADEGQVIPFKNIPCVRLGTEPIRVTGCLEVVDAWELFQDYIKMGKMEVARFEDKPEKELAWWGARIEDYLREKDMVKTPDCSYARFVRKKFPQVWERYVRGQEQEENGVQSGDLR